MGDSQSPKWPADLSKVTSVGSILLLLVFLVKVYAVSRYSLTTMTGLVAATPLQVVLGTLSIYAYLVMPALALGVAWVGVRAAWQHRAGGLAPSARPILIGIVVVTALLSPVEFLETGVALLAACLRLELRIWLRPTRIAGTGGLSSEWALIRASSQGAGVWSWVRLPALPPLPWWQRLLSWLLLVIAVTEAWRSPNLHVAGLGWWAVAAAVILEAPFSVWFRQLLGSGWAKNARRRLWSWLGRPLATDIRSVKKSGQAIAGHLRGRTLVYVGGATAVCYLMATIETPWAPAQIFVLSSPIEVSTQDKAVVNRVLNVERAHVLVGYLLAKDDDTLTVLDADTRRIVHPPVQAIRAQPLCHRDQEQLPGKEPLWWRLQDVDYNSHNITCETLREALLPARGMAFSPVVQPTATLGGAATSAAETSATQGRALLAAAGWDGALGLWDPATGQLLGTLPPLPDAPRVDAPPESGQAPYPIAFSPDGQTLAAASPHGTVAVRGTRTLTDQPTVLAAARTPTGSPSGVTALMFTPDSKMLITTAGGTTRLWNVDTGIRVSELPPEAGSTITMAVATSSGRTILATGGSDDQIRLWDLTDPAQPAAVGGAFPVHQDHALNRVYAMAFSPDGTTLAAGGGRRDYVRQRFTDPYSADAAIRLWDLTDRLRDPEHAAAPAPLGQPLTGHTGAVNAIDFSSDGRSLATGSSDATIRLWSLADQSHPTLISELSGHTGAVNAIDFSPDGQTLATTGTDQRIRLWGLPPTDGRARPWTVLTAP